MKRTDILVRSKIGYKEVKITNKNDLIEFVANQFKNLAKKNLRVPIQLYHL